MSVDIKASRTASSSDVINWDGGQRLTLQNGQTATCKALHAGQLYCLFLYNSAGADKNIPVTVVWSNSQPPQLVTVPGTTADQGLATLVFVSGNDTNSVSVSITNTLNASIDCWIGSVEMPTNTSGLQNAPLPNNGVPQPFTKYRRYYAVVPASWHQLTIESDIQQFISVQFSESFATVYIVNPTQTPTQNVVALGSTSDQYKIVTPSGQPQLLTYSFQGNGTQLVWLDADSQQDSLNATLKLQSLAVKP